MQAIISSLQNQSLAHLEAGIPYEVWTLIDAPQAAQTLLDGLATHTAPTNV